ncbi:hypothetical protein [Thomasclavelia cocleata]|nr:hypothetical protein [Thomasclavelia cocleata]
MLVVLKKEDAETILNLKTTTIADLQHYMLNGWHIVEYLHYGL